MSKQHRIPPMPNNSAVAGMLQAMNVPPDLEWDPDNPLVVNACTGHNEVHLPECDGECEKITMDEFDIAIENEKRAWARLGWDKGNFGPDLLLQTVQIKTLIDIVMDKLGMTHDEFNAVFKPNMLTLMKDITKNVKAFQDAQINRSRLIVPNGPIQ